LRAGQGYCGWRRGMNWNRIDRLTDRMERGAAVVLVAALLMLLTAHGFDALLWQVERAALGPRVVMVDE